MWYIFEINRDNEKLNYIRIVCKHNEFFIYSMNDFFKWIKLIDHNSKLICDNLKYEGSYILKWMNENGFKESEIRNQKKMKSKTYLTLLTVQNWYQIKVKIGKKVILFQQLQSYTNNTISKIKKQLKRDKDDTLYVMRDIYANCFEEYEKITIGSESLKTYKKMINQDTFDFLYPEVNDEIYDNIQLALRGGINYIKEENMVIKQNIYRYDEKSAYPSICSSNRLLPYSIPVYGSGDFVPDEVFKIAILHIKICCELKDDGFPCISDRSVYSIFSEETMLENTENRIIEMWITTVDLENIYRNYDIEYIKTIEYYAFESCEAHKLFGDYMKKFYEDKKNAKNEFYKLNAKMKLNNLIGQFGKRRNGELETYTIEKQIKKATTIKKVYNAITAFVTSYARLILLEKAHLVDKENILYMDTDSIHSLVEIDGLDIGDELGQWALEAVATEGIFIKQKCYSEKVDGEWDFKCCGLSDISSEKLTIDKFYKGNRIKQTTLERMPSGLYNYTDSFITL